MKERDLVLLEQVEDAVVVLLHHVLLAREHFFQVKGEAFDLDAVLGKVVPGVVVMLRGLQQGLGGNAADIGAGAAGRRSAFVVLPLIDASGGKAQLGGADGGHVAAWPRTDDDDVE